MTKIVQYIFNLNDQTIVLIVLLLFIDIIMIVYQGWNAVLIIIGAIIMVPILIKFLFNPMVKLVNLLREKYDNE
jgi:type III secretory pathway component EscS